MRKNVKLSVVDSSITVDNSIDKHEESPHICKHNYVIGSTTKGCSECYIESLEVANTALKTSLRNLVKLKDYKDTVGKDEHYITNQRLAWANARAVIKK